MGLSSILTVVNFLLVGYLCSESTALFIGGRHTMVDYNECGLWNDQGKKQGFVFNDYCPVDVTFPGAEWQLLAVSYRSGNRFYSFSGNAYRRKRGVRSLQPLCNYTVLESKVLHDGHDGIGVKHRFDIGLLILTKQETWDFRGRTVTIEFKVEYPSDRCQCDQIEDLRIVHAVDPDPDRFPFYTYTTINDVLFPGGVALQHYAHAVGPFSCNTLSYGICKRPPTASYTEEVGFSKFKDSTYARYYDPGPRGQNGFRCDLTLHYRYRQPLLKCSRAVSFRFVVTWGYHPSQAVYNFQQIYSKICHSCEPLHFPQSSYCSTGCKNWCPCQYSKDTTYTYKEKIDHCPPNSSTISTVPIEITPTPSTTFSSSISTSVTSTTTPATSISTSSRSSVSSVVGIAPRLTPTTTTPTPTIILNYTIVNHLPQTSSIHSSFIFTSTVTSTVTVTETTTVTITSVTAPTSKVPTEPSKSTSDIRPSPSPTEATTRRTPPTIDAEVVDENSTSHDHTPDADDPSITTSDSTTNTSTTNAPSVSTTGDSRNKSDSHLTEDILKAMDVIESAAERFFTLGSDEVFFELEEEVALVRVLDMFPTVCPPLNDTSRAFMDSIDLFNVRDAYDRYVEECPLRTNTSITGSNL